MKFFNFYSSLSLISTKVKNCQYLIVKRAQKTTRKLLKMSHIKAYKVDMPKILVCDVGVLTPADLFEGKKPIFSNIPFTLPQWTIPFHISSSFTELYWMILDLWPNTKCKVVHWNPKNTVLIIVFILTFGGGFHINAIHVNHPEWF